MAQATPVAERAARGSPRTAASASARGRVAHLLTAAASAVLVAGLAHATTAQGGYYPAGRPVLAGSVGLAAGLVLLATVVATRRWTVIPHPAPRPVLLALAALAGYAAGRGAWSPEPAAGVSRAMLALGVAAVVLVVARLTAEQASTLVTGLLGLGTVVASAGWVGVVWHREPWGLGNDGVWRAASTLTYANAAAALLVPLLLLALSTLVSRPGNPWLTACGVVLMTGTALTQSRAAGLALLVGLAVLGRLAGWGRLGAAVVAPALGAGLALAGAAGSVPLAAAPGRLAAAVALPVGMALAVAASAVTAAPAPVRRVLRVAVPAGLTAVAGAALLALGPPQTLVTALQVRLSGPTGPRWDALEAAARLAAQHPVLGAGPGNREAFLRWTMPDGPTATMRYVHNEYAQTLVELGLLGLGLVVAVLAAAAVAVRSGVRAERATPAGSGVAAGAAAGLAALAVHSALDFLWHVPVVPLIGAALIGLAARPGLSTIRSEGGPT